MKFIFDAERLLPHGTLYQLKGGWWGCEWWLTTSTFPRVFEGWHLYEAPALDGIGGDLARYAASGDPVTLSEPYEVDPSRADYPLWRREIPHDSARGKYVVDARLTAWLETLCADAEWAVVPIVPTRGGGSSPGLVYRQGDLPVGLLLPRKYGADDHAVLRHEAVAA